MTEKSCLIVGAGLSGLMAAQTLQAAGVGVTVLEKAGVVGGRMATRQLLLPQGETPLATFDYGAQYFTVRDDRFESWVQGWLQAGVVVHWSEGFATPDTSSEDASSYRDGHPRYRGRTGMRSIPAHLARKVNVRLKQAVSSARYDGGWLVETEAGEEFTAAALLVTAPVPRSLDLLDRATLSPAVRRTLEQIDYDPCIALLAVLDGPSNVPQPGGLWPGGSAISWMADNEQKGISRRPAVTVHGSPEFSNAHFESAVDEVAHLLLEEARPWLGSDVIAHQLQRWRYSLPVHLHERRYLFTTDPGPVVFAGDAFAGPRVEGAALSGLAAAAALLAFFQENGEGGPDDG